MFPNRLLQDFKHSKGLLMAFYCAFTVSFAAPTLASNPTNNPTNNLTNNKAKQVERKYLDLKARYTRDDERIRVLVQAKQIPARKALKKVNVIEQVSIPDADAWNKLRQFAKANKIQVLQQVDRSGLVAMELTQKQLDKLIKSNRIDYLAEDHLFEPRLNKSTDFINVDMVLAAGFAGEGQAIAILDSGIQLNHELLRNRVVEEACFSSGLVSLCPNGEQRQFGPGAGRDCRDRFNLDDCRHGTHTAGIAGGYFAYDYYGVASKADLVSVQIFTLTSPTSTRLAAFSSDLAAALDWILNDAQTPNIAAVNLSLGVGRYTADCNTNPLADLIQILRSQGIATVTATGNEGYDGAINWPGCITNSISVGASAKEANSIPLFSNTSNIVDLLAPGVSIMSSIAHATLNQQYQHRSGTSASAAHVSGAFAVLRSAKPDASVQQIENALKTTGIPITDTSSGITIPRIDLFAAYNLLISEPVEPPSDTCFEIPGEIASSVGEISNQSTKFWDTYATQGGLFRVRLNSTASSGSFAVELILGGARSTISVAAGGSAFVDFPNISAGQHTLQVKAVTSGVSIGSLSVEQPVAQGAVLTGTCVTDLPKGVPGIVTPNAGPIAQNETLAWVINKADVRNVRIQITSTAILNSREIVVSLNNVPVTISIDANQTTFVDYANVNYGIANLLIKANTTGVSLGKIEALSY